MEKMLKIVIYELKRHMNKQFFIMTLVFPLIIVMFSLLPQFLGGIERSEERVIAVVDEVSIFSNLEQALQGTDFKVIEKEASIETLAELVEEGTIFGFMLLKEEYLAQNEVHFYSKDPDLSGRGQVLSNTFQSLIMQKRLQEAGVPFEKQGEILQPLSFVEFSIGGEEWGPASFIAPFAMILILAISMTNTGSMLFYGVINEKKERMVEIVLSSVDALSLMRGKIIAYTILGLMQLLIWLAAALTAINFFFRDIPILNYISLNELPFFVLVFIMAYIFFAALFAAVASTMEDAQSAQGMTGLIFVLPMLPVFFMTPVMFNPNGIIARLITYLPIPGGLMLRMAFTSVPIWERLVSLIVLALTTLLLAYLGGKIFRVGILMYGKSFSLREIWRWVREQ